MSESKPKTTPIMDGLTAFLNAVDKAVRGERERCLKIVEPYCNSSSMARRIFDSIEGVKK
jgi:hypothetical protein